MEISGGLNINTLATSQEMKVSPAKGNVDNSQIVEKTRHKQRLKDTPSIPFDDENLSEEELMGVVGKVNRDIIAYDRKLEISVHEKTRKIMVKVINTNNDEVIRELPPEKSLDMLAKIWELAGIIIDEKI